MTNFVRTLLGLLTVLSAGPAGAGTFVEDFEDYSEGGAFANVLQPGSNPVKGWWSESYYSKPDEAGASVVIVSPMEDGPGGGRCMQLWGLNDTPRVSNYFGPHEHEGVSYEGSVGQPLIGSGNRLQWDAFSSAGQYLTFQILDPSGPVLSVSIKPDGLWVNGANLGTDALGTSEAAWRRFEIANLDVGAGTFDLKVSVWDRGTGNFKECQSDAGLVFQPREAPGALQSFAAFFDGITGGHEAVLIDNFQVVSPDP